MNRTSSTKPKTILVTGASGFVALNVIHELAKSPNKIRATVRNLNDEKKIQVVKRAANGLKYPIEFVYADLLKPDTWNDACKDVE